MSQYNDPAIRSLNQFLLPVTAEAATRLYPLGVPTSEEQLDQARDDVLAASGPDFLRRLREYCALLESDKKIRAAVEKLRGEVEDADKQLAREDDAFVADLVPIRRELVERAPEADDSDAGRPERYDPTNPRQANEWHEWIWTLANFDAIAEDREEKIIERRDLDGSRSRMLVAILEAKLRDLAFPFNDRLAPRPDLMDLYDRMSAIGRRQVAAYRRVEQLGEESGYLGLLHVEHVASKLEPDLRPFETADELRERAEEALKEPDLFRLAEILRPREARGPLADEEREALSRVEAVCRTEVERLHRPLRQRLDDRRRSWPKIAVGRIGWLPPTIGFAVDLVGFVALVVIAGGFIRGLF